MQGDGGRRKWRVEIKMSNKYACRIERGEQKDVSLPKTHETRKRWQQWTKCGYGQGGIRGAVKVPTSGR